VISRRSAKVTVGVFVLACLVGSLAQSTSAEDWPCWRGLRQDGASREAGLLTEWPKDGPRQLWKIPLSGGFSSVVVADGRLFAVTKEKNEEVVLCLDAATGKELWSYRYDCDYAVHRSFTGGGAPKARTGPRATPVVDGDRVFTLGATGTLLCLNVHDGKPVWRQDLLKLASTKCPTQGYCGSPVVVGDQLYLSLGGQKGNCIAALNKMDGHVIWQALDDPLGHASPVWVQSGSLPQMIFFTGAGAVGVDPQDGKLLWRYPWKTSFNLHIATPIVSDGKVFISSNYGTGGAVFRLSGGSEPETVWKSKSMQNHFSTSVLHDGYLYGFSEARLRCVDFQTGDVKWDKGGLGKGSLVLADGNLIVLGEHGELVLVKASPANYKQVSRCQVFDSGTLTWTVPTLSGGRLYVRSENALVAFDVRGKGS
jgi:outer membrane protein assembly factor BamB